MTTECILDKSAKTMPIVDAINISIINLTLLKYIPVNLIRILLNG